MCREGSVEQTRQTLELLDGTGLPRTGGHNLDDLKKLQEHLHTQWPGTWRLALFEKEQNYRCVWRDDRRSRHTIALYLEDGHYAFLAKPQQLFNAHDYCIDCRRTVKPGYRHPQDCQALCRLCMRFGPQFPCKKDRQYGRVQCQECLFTFSNGDCFDYHRQTHTPNALDGRSGRERRSICRLRWAFEFLHLLPVILGEFAPTAKRCTMPTCHMPVGEVRKLSAASAVTLTTWSNLTVGFNRSPTMMLEIQRWQRRPFDTKRSVVERNTSCTCSGMLSALRTQESN